MHKILLFITLLLVPAVVFAADTSVATQTAALKVDYQLPYPGMLPDNPLYFVKQARDLILDKLIMDPVKKAEFYILQGDKRIAMGVALDASGKNSLGEQVISKGEKYMNNAVQSLLGLKSQGKEVPAFTVDHLSQSLAKHAEVLTAEVDKAGGAERAGLSASLTLVGQLRSDLDKLK
jgi:hypothetical protein